MTQEAASASEAVGQPTEMCNIGKLCSILMYVGRYFIVYIILYVF